MTPTHTNTWLNDALHVVLQYSKTEVGAPQLGMVAFL